MNYTHLLPSVTLQYSEGGRQVSDPGRTRGYAYCDRALLIRKLTKCVCFVSELLEGVIILCELTKSKRGSLSRYGECSGIKWEQLSSANEFY